MFKTPELRKTYSGSQMEEASLPRRGGSSEHFLMFCKMILDYEDYENTHREDILRRRHTSSPLGSTGSAAESNLSSSQEESMAGLDSPPPMGTSVLISDEDSGEPSQLVMSTNLRSSSADDDEEVTCYCKKPYAGRPMIECSSCSTWVHLACAKVKRTAIPDMWYCALCKTKSTKGGAKARARARARKSKATTRDPLGPNSPNIRKKSLWSKVFGLNNWLGAPFVSSDWLWMFSILPIFRQNVLEKKNGAFSLLSPSLLVPSET